MKTIKAVCHECRGSGVFVGVCEAAGTGVVCLICAGRGWRAITYTPFVARTRRAGITRVFQSGRTERTAGIAYAAFLKGDTP